MVGDHCRLRAADNEHNSKIAQTDSSPHPTGETVLPTAAVSVLADLSSSTSWVDPSVLATLAKAKAKAIAAGEAINEKEYEVQTVAKSIQQSLLIMEKMFHRIDTPREFLGFAPKTGHLNTVVRTFRARVYISMPRARRVRGNTDDSSNQRCK